MARIVSGRWRGRVIAAPSGQTTRPTSDRVREAVFSSFGSEFGDLTGLRFLDLFAGSGAMGLEALSRGASSADFVESDPKAAKTIETNIRTLEAGRSARLHRIPAERFLSRARESGEQWDIIWLDPPYDLSTVAVTEVVQQLAGLVAGDGLIAIERPRREEFDWPEPFVALRERRYGEARIWYGQ